MTGTSRRGFLRSASALALGSAFGNLTLLSAAANANVAKSSADYRALVCIFMYGGNDSFNMVAPLNGDARAQYVQTRSNLALPASALLPLNPVSNGGASDGCAYGLCDGKVAGEAIGTAGLHQLFGMKKLAVVANIGALVQPTTKAQYAQGTVPLPKQLYSHDDQQIFWQTCGTTVGSGWGGRMADLLQTSNPDPTLPMAIAVGGISPMLAGHATSQYSINPAPIGVTSTFALNGIGSPFKEARRDLFETLITEGNQTHAIERAIATRVRRSRVNGTVFADALAQATSASFPDTSLGNQLDMVARLISVRDLIGAPRQVFFVQIGGFDTHSEQLSAHPRALSHLAQGMRAFHDVIETLGMGPNVTTFTASDFGRTLSSNGDGSDHAWGAHHLVMGGAVAGGRFFGMMPSLDVAGPDVGSSSQVIPTTSVDQYAATLGAWLGVPPGSLGDIFPNLGNFSSADLGFLQGS